MNTSAATVTYAIREEFEPALRSVREALCGRDLRIVGELDLSGRLERSLRIKLPPCVLLYIWPSARFLESNRIPATAGLLLPLHVVISGRNGRTEIHIMRCSSADRDGVLASVRKLQSELRQALEHVAMRLSLVS